MEIRCRICNSNNIIKKDDGYICDECGTKYTSEEMKKLFVEADQQPVSIQKSVPVDTNNQKGVQSGVSKTLSDRKIMIPLVLIIIAVIGYVIWDNILFGKDKAVYDLVAAEQYSFKDPSSVQLVNAYYYDDGTDPIVWATVSANNSYGMPVRACYAFMKSGSVESDYCGQNKTNVNIAKINKKLKKN